MSTATSTRDLHEVFQEAATAAGFAPSIHNTQPWHWHIRPDGMELWSAPARQLSATDADGRMMTISCGVALHHALVALSALGYPGEVIVLAEDDTPLSPRSEPRLLARITVGQYQQAAVSTMRLYQTLAIRHTDRRPVDGEPVPPELLSAIVNAVNGQDPHYLVSPGAQLHVLHRDQIIELASAASYAQSVESDDEALRSELSYWVGGQRPEGAGIPAANIPTAAPQTTVPGRDFGQSGTLPISEAHDRAASYGLLYTDRDDPVGWLTAGQALSAGWLAATELGVSVLPLSAVIEVVTTRLRLREMITSDSYPQIVVRLGNADPDTAGPRPTPRLATAYTVTVDPA